MFASFEIFFLDSFGELKLSFSEVCFKFAPQASQNLASCLFSFPQIGQETTLFRLSAVIFYLLTFFTESFIPLSTACLKSLENLKTGTKCSSTKTFSPVRGFLA